jgi:hypothetical protein
MSAESQINDLMAGFDLRSALEDVMFQVYEREFSPFPFLQIPDRHGNVSRERTDEERDCLRYMIAEQLKDDAEHERLQH